MTEKLPVTRAMPELVNFYAEGEIACDPHVQQRFKIIFEEAWNQIPPEDRRAIERYFETNDHQLKVQLRDNHHNFRRGPSGCASAQYIHGIGYDEVIYQSSTTKKLTGESCRYLIAHELGHLFLHVSDSRHGSSPDAAEEEVGELLLKRWMYPDDSESRLASEEYLIDQGLQG